MVRNALKSGAPTAPVALAAPATTSVCFCDFGLCQCQRSLQLGISQLSRAMFSMEALVERSEADGEALASPSTRGSKRANLLSSFLSRADYFIGRPHIVDLRAFGLLGFEQWSTP